LPARQPQRRRGAARLFGQHRRPAQVLTNFIKDNTPQVAGTDEVDTQPTLGFQRVIQRAIMHVQSTGNGKKEVTGANVLVAIFGEKDSHAVYYLHQQGVTRLDVVNFIAHGIKKASRPSPPSAEKPSRGRGRKAVASATKGSPLEQFTQNLNQLAKDGKIDPLIGRDYEVERVIQILCRRRKNNPLLVGEAGVGKTAIAEGLAWRITQGDVPEMLADAWCIRSTWARCWRAPSTAATSSSASRACSSSSRTSPTPSCSSTRSTP
jgi:ATP-dependent Clp protease ATP-binding subunit ClpA